MMDEVTIENENQEKEQILYPGLVERIKAAFTDSCILIALMLSITFIFSNFEGLPDYVRALAFIFLFFVYDPLLISLFGGTLGHYLIGLRVKNKSDQDKNISFPLAIIRFIIKLLLGLLSFLFISTSNEKLAIHDRLVNSIVVYKRS